MKREVNPQDTTRAYAFEMWMSAPMPMVTFFKTLNVSRLVKVSKRGGVKFNMLMCYCIGRAASRVKEFYLLPVGDKLMQYDNIAVNTIVANSKGEVSSCDIPFTGDLGQFNRDYLRLTRQVAESCTDHDLSEDSMVIGTSALAQYEIDGAVGMYSGIFNNPFLIWGKYKRQWWKTTLTLSFQFHHTQMDGAHAARFLSLIQEEIDTITMNDERLTKKDEDYAAELQLLALGSWLLTLNSQLSTNMTINEIQDQIIEEFSELDDWMDKYQLLIDLGSEQEPLAEEYKTDSNLIEGCQSRVWLQADEVDDRLIFQAESDALIVKGIVSLLLKVLSGHTAEEIADADLYFIEEIGLKEHLSPTRSNGLVAMVKQMRLYALAYKAKHAQA